MFDYIIKVRDGETERFYYACASSEDEAWEQVRIEEGLGNLSDHLFEVKQLQESPYLICSRPIANPYVG